MVYADLSILDQLFIMSASERKLRGLKNRKRSIISSFAAIKAYVAAYQAEKDKCEVPVRLENLVALWTEFNEVQIELETLEESEEMLDTYLKERGEFERAYYRIKGTLLMLDQPSSEAQNVAAHQERSNQSSNVKLPDIKLPVFSGDFESWMNFHDLFISLVHSSASLSTIQKFYYLRSSLSGEALKLIQTIPISNEQYSVAWNLLVSHFQNPRRLKRSYVQSLFDFPSMKRESASELHTLLEKFQTNVKILKQLGENTDHWDVLLIYLLSSRLDAVTRRDWEEHSETHNATKFQQMTEFLEHRVNVLESVASSSADIPYAARKNNLPRSGSYSAIHQSARPCPACSNPHLLYQCETFSEFAIEEKEALVRSNNLCRNCLRWGHMARNCASESSCRKCNGRHHTQLCNTTGSEAANQSSSAPEVANHASGSRNHDENAAYSGITSCTSRDTTRGKMFLATASIIMVDDNGNEHQVRALLDSGSECNFATESLIRKMHVRRFPANLPITGIGHSSTRVNWKFQSLVKSRVSNYCTRIEACILPKVTADLPSSSVNISRWPIPTGIHLADPTFNQSGPIEVVLGAEVFFNVFTVAGRISLGETLPTLVNSAFGWIVSGCDTQGDAPLTVVCNVASKSEFLKYQLQSNVGSNSGQIQQAKLHQRSQQSRVFYSSSFYYKQQRLRR